MYYSYVSLCHLWALNYRIYMYTYKRISKNHTSLDCKQPSVAGHLLSRMKGTEVRTLSTYYVYAMYTEQCTRFYTHATAI